MSSTCGRCTPRERLNAGDRISPPRSQPIGGGRHAPRSSVTIPDGSRFLGVIDEGAGMHVRGVVGSATVLAAAMLAWSAAPFAQGAAPQAPPAGQGRGGGGGGGVAFG